MPINHLKTNAITDWTQADLDAQITAGNFPPGTLLADITLPSDWNAAHTNPDIADITGLQTALDSKVDENAAITGATNTKITYDAKGLVTGGAAATTADINDSSNRRYVTDAQLVVIENTSGTNSGDVSVTDSAEIDFTLAGQNITASIVASSIDESKLDASVNASLDLADTAIQNLAGLGITATASEINILDGATLTTTELNYVDGVTSAIQTQLDAKQGDITLTTIGTSGAATLIGDTLNIPNYADTDTGITQITGDIAAGPGSGSQAATLATVNSNVGSFTNASITVNGKGLVTAASSGSAPVTSVLGTAGRITSTGGATPQIDIDATYTGQNTITTLGTITTGVWNGTDIAYANIAQGSALSVLGVAGNATADLASIAAASDHQVMRRSGTSIGFGAVNLAQSNAVTGALGAANGGTGVANNAASTLTISGNFGTTLTVSNTTSVTLPTSGTLYGTASGSITSAQLATSLTDETGSGSAVFATSPTLVTPALGVATATSINFGQDALNYYDEGTFTPAIEGTGTAGVGTYSVQTGSYTRIGRQVTVIINLTWSAHTGTGSMNVTGLPFTVSEISPAAVTYSNIALTANNTLSAAALAGGTIMQPLQNPTGGGAIAAVTLDTAATFRATCTYFV